MTAKAPSIDMAGKIVGKWTVEDRASGGRWRCRCACGAVNTVRGVELRKGHSMGCRQCAHVGQRRTHGQASAKLGFTHKYRAWVGMTQRVRDRKSPRAAWYAGVPIHPAWNASFEAFDRDVPNPPTDGHTLDRIRAELGYVPGNVRWATRSEQARNRRSNRLVTLGGRTQCLAAWAEELGLSESGLRYRLRHGKKPIMLPTGETVLQRVTSTNLLAIEGPKDG